MRTWYTTLSSQKFCIKCMKFKTLCMYSPHSLTLSRVFATVKNFIYFHFLFIEEGHKERSYLLVHFPNAPNGWGGKLVQVFYVDVKDLTIWISICCTPGSTTTGNWYIKPDSDTEAGTLIRNVVILAMRPVLPLGPCYHFWFLLSQ